jgi:hypothetical protein
MFLNIEALDLQSCAETSSDVEARLYSLAEMCLHIEALDRWSYAETSSDVEAHYIPSRRLTTTTASTRSALSRHAAHIPTRQTL